MPSSGRPWPASLGLWLGSATLAVACAAYGGSLWRARTRAAANAQASDANAVATLVPRVDGEGEHRKDGPAEAVARGQKSSPSGVAPPPTTAMPRPIPQGQAGLDVVAPLPMAVTLGGHYLGDTPLFGVAVAPGVLHLKLESRQEGLVAWRKLRVPRGESRRVQGEGGRGRLLVEARPWAWVQRGLYPAGETPRDDELWAGDYVLTVECPDGRRRQQTVTVREHQTTRLQLRCD